MRAQIFILGVCATARAAQWQYKMIGLLISIRIESMRARSTNLFFASHSVGPRILFALAELFDLYRIEHSTNPFRTSQI